MYANIIISSFLQMRDYNNYDSFATASLVFGHLAFIICMVVIGLLTYSVLSFFYKYPKLS